MIALNTGFVPSGIVVQWAGETWMPGISQRFRTGFFRGRGSDTVEFSEVTVETQ